MNYKAVISVVGKCLMIEAVLMLVPMLIGFVYGENTYLSFLIPILGLTAVGIPASIVGNKDNSFYAKEGFISVALVWITISLFGALPFVIDGCIPNYIDAIFETVSGFTTTGATILQSGKPEIMSKSLMFWRVFTHFIGGMGIIVFVLAVLPNDSSSMHIYRAETPGPQASKLVSKMRHTARILYLIYSGMTLIEVIMLICGGMPIFDAFLVAFSTAGTGGFMQYSESMMYYNSVYCEMVVAVFMFLFSVNFNVFYLIIIGKFSKALLSEELRAYFIITVVATLTIALNILSSVQNFGEAIRYSFFQVTSISSTTGFYSYDFETWPAFSKGVLLVLMVIGACGGSTGGGLKVSRLSILVKSVASDLKQIFNPRAVVTTKFEGKPLTKQEENSVKTYFVVWFCIVIVSILLLMLDPFASGPDGVLTNISACLTCIGNVGPGLSKIGPATNIQFAGYHPLSKILLSFVMLVGRLEIYPMLILFSPRTWKKAG